MSWASTAASAGPTHSLPFDPLGISVNRSSQSLQPLTRSLDPLPVDHLQQQQQQQQRSPGKENGRMKGSMPQNRSQTPHKTFMSRSAGSAAKLHSKALSVQEDDDVATNDEENLNLDDLFDSEISSPRSSWASDMEIQMEGNGMESTSLSLPPPASGKLAGSLKSSTNRRKRHGASEKDGVAGGSNPSPAKKQGLANTSQSNQNLQTSSSIASLGGVSSGPKRVKTSDDGGAGMATSSGRPKKPASRATDPNDLSAPLEAVEQSSRQPRRRRLPSATNSYGPPTSYARDNMYNNDFCESCHQSGEFVCCEACPRSFHFVCAEPPCDFDDVSKLDHWFCNVCRTSKLPPPPAPPGIFHKLLENIHRMNPVSYSLPEDIKRYFKGVSWDQATGDFVNPLETKQARGQRGFYTTDTDLFRLSADDGRPLMCHKCGKSALKGPIITCDFCPLSWHLDCMDPPMTAPLPPNKRWICPAHAEPLLPRTRKVNKNLHEVTVADPDFRNDGDIEVILDDSFPTDRRIDRRRRITYKVPEQSIKLAFCKKMQGTDRDENGIEKPRQVMECTEPLPTTNDLTARVKTPPPHIFDQYQSIWRQSNPSSTSTTDMDDETKLWLSSLLQFYEDVVCTLLPTDQNTTEKNNLNVLYRAAMGNHEAMDIVAPTSETTKVPEGLSETEASLFRQFIAWKQLMACQKKVSESSSS